MKVAETGISSDTTARSDICFGALDTSSKVPLYYQLVVLLRNHIYSGELRACARVPGEQELCAMFNVSRITAKRALNELAASGLVKRERGRGTHVVSQPQGPVVNASIDGWLENVSLMGVKTVAQVLEFDYVTVDEDVRKMLRVERGTEIQRSVRVRYLNKDPMSYLVTFVPADIGRKFAVEDLNKYSLLQLLERAGVEVESVRQSISATVADSTIAPVLKIPEGSPLIEVRRVVLDVTARPVEYIHVVYRPDLYQVEMTMESVHDKSPRNWTSQNSPDSTCPSPCEYRVLSNGGVHYVKEELTNESER
jgi:GntR family transcriptional regulator